MAEDPQTALTPHILNCLDITRRGNMRLRLNANKWINKEKIARSG
jgi:hypothetical protein